MKPLHTPRSNGGAKYEPRQTPNCQHLLPILNIVVYIFGTLYLLSSNILIGPQHRLNSYSFSPPSSRRGLPAACLTDSSETVGARSPHGFDSNVTVLFLLHVAHPRQGLVWHCTVFALKASSIPRDHKHRHSSVPPSTLTARVHAPPFNSGCMHGCVHAHPSQL